MKLKINVFLIVLIAFLTVGCNNKTDVPHKKSDIIKKGDIEISNAWIRPGAAEMNTAFFFDVYNFSEVADTLIGAASDVSEIVEIHETFKQGEDMMGMRSVDKIAIESKSKFEFKPMHHHIMLIKIIKDLKIDDEKIVKLTFKNAGTIAVKAKVIDKKMMKH